MMMMISVYILSGLAQLHKVLIAMQLFDGKFRKQQLQAYTGLAILMQPKLCLGPSNISLVHPVHLFYLSTSEICNISMYIIFLRFCFNCIKHYLLDI